MTEQRLSIAMCTYNGARYLQEQLDSIATQTRTPNELVLCDDRSSDATTEIIESFAIEAAFPVRLYVNEENLGSTKNFEKAIGLCTGDVVVLSDQDDVWYSEKLIRIEDAFSGSPRTGLVFSDAEVVDEHLQPLGYSLWQSVGFSRNDQELIARGKAFDALLRRSIVTGATMAFRAWLKDVVLPIPEGWVHDGWISLLAAALTNLSPIQDSLIKYRQHPSNQIGGVRKSFGGRLGNVRHTDSVAYAETKARYVEAYDRLLKYVDASENPDIFSKHKAKIRHLHARSEMPKAAPLRLPSVLRELVGLRYHRYSNGWSSVAKDVFLPS